jgi:hypothetical protein
MEQIENRVSGTEDKVEKLDQTVKDHKNANMDGKSKTSGTPWKDQIF